MKKYLFGFVFAVSSFGGVVATNAGSLAVLPVEHSHWVSIGGDQKSTSTAEELQITNGSSGSINYGISYVELGFIDFSKKPVSAASAVLMQSYQNGMGTFSQTGLNYYFGIDAPANENVNLNIFSVIDLYNSGSPDSFSQGHLSIWEEQRDGSYSQIWSLFKRIEASGGSFNQSYDNDVLLKTNTVYKISMETWAYTTFGKATAFVDPYITILDDNPALALVFNGTGNAPSLTAIPDPFAPVPEPATMILFGTGLAGLAAARRRKKAC